jgi:tetratricopeptide (TPR) repeat protein
VTAPPANTQQRAVMAVTVVGQQAGVAASNLWSRMLESGKVLASIVGWAAGVVVPILVVLILLRQLRRPLINIDTLALPSTLTNEGMSATALTDQLGDQIDSIEYAARPEAWQQNWVLSSESNLPEVQVPLTGTSLPVLLGLIDDAFGRRALHVTWEVTAHIESPQLTAWSITVRLSGHRTHTVPFDPADPMTAVTAVSRAVVGDAEPLVLARALLYGSDCDDARDLALMRLRTVTAPRDESQAYNFLGLTDECVGIAGQNLDEAKHYYEMALAVDPKNPLPHVNLGRLSAVMHDSAGTRLHFEMAQRLSRHEPAIYDSWGWSLLTLGNAQAAIPKLKRVIDLDPRVPSAYLNLGWAYLALNDTARALASFADGLARSPTDLRTTKEYAYDLLEIQQWSGAAATYARALALDTNDVDTRFYFAQSLEHLRPTGPAQAVCQYERVVMGAGLGDAYYVNAMSALHRLGGACRRA